MTFFPDGKPALPGGCPAAVDGPAAKGPALLPAAKKPRAHAVSTQSRVVRILAAVACAAAAGAAAAPREARYTAAFSDGLRISGPEIAGWGAPDAVPKLNNQPLLNTTHPVRWLRDDALAPGQTPDAFVEFVNGDRLPGKVLASRDAQQQPMSPPLPAHLLVEPGIPLKDPGNNTLDQVRVVTHIVRRIVWQRPATDRYRPGTLLSRDGRKLAFRHCRFLPAEVRLLTESGIEQTPFSDIAELHLPRADPWDAYYDELALLSPDLKSRLFQLETGTGLMATASTLRFLVPGYGDAANADTWYHLIQPAWSLDAFAVRHREIRIRRYFAPHEVPLLRIAPVWSVNRSAVHSGWLWRANRTVYGRPLETGKQACGWGFGVHGRSELTFSLPPEAVAFRTKLKLDCSAGDGGCVRAAVALGATTRREDPAAYKPGRPIYRSGLLIGSKTVLETGSLSLRPAGRNETRLLTLSVDPVDQGHPQDADPLDIRDTLNWLEPTVLLEQQALAAEIYRRKIRGIVPWRGWVVEDANGVPLRLVGRWQPTPGGGTAYRFDVLPQRPLTLSRTLTLRPEQKWLLIAAWRPTEEAHRSKIEVRVDGASAAEYELPVAVSQGLQPRPLVVPLESPGGRKVEVQIVQRPVDAAARNIVTHWRTIAFVDRLPMLRELFEDTGEFVPVRKPGGKPPPHARISTEHAYSAAGCVKIPPGGPFKMDFSDAPAPIREYPKWGEYRYIRFAFRKPGRENVVLELGHDGREDRRLQYFAGRGRPPVEGAIRVWKWSASAGLPDEWIVETRDLYNDFGNFSGNLTSLMLSCTGGSEALFDHVYLARTTDDFELARAERTLTPDVAARMARQATAQTVLDKALPAVVLIEDGPRRYTGTIVNKHGLVLTAGHLAVGPQREVKVILSDGRQLSGQTLGVDRAHDAAMLRITNQAEYPFLDIAAPVEDLRKELLLGVAHPPELEAGRRPLAHLTWFRGNLNELIWTHVSAKVIGSGGPLLIATSDSPNEGKLIGVNTGRAWDGLLYTPIERLRANWDRLEKGEAWGRWAPAAGPVLGIYTATAENGPKISQIVPNGPAQKAGLKLGDVIRAIDGRKPDGQRDLAPILTTKDPGQQVEVRIDRAGQTLNVNVILGARQ